MSDRTGGAADGAPGTATGEGVDGTGDTDTNGVGDGGPLGGRALGAGVAALVAVHLLAAFALGDPPLPALIGVEAVAVGLLLAGDAVATGRRRATTAAVGTLLGLGAVGAALGPAGVAPWVAAVGVLAVAAGALYAGHRYDRHLAGGGSA